MKTARLLLASLSLAVLTACGSESITAPAATGGAARSITSSDTTGTNNFDGTTERTDRGCSGTLVVHTNEYGLTSLECVRDERGPMMGSGT